MDPQFDQPSAEPPGGNPYDAPVDGVPAEGIVELDKSARTWGMLCHLSALSAYVTAVGWIVGPLIVWMVKKDEYPFVDDQGKESLNFQLSMLLYALVAGVMVFCVIGIPLLIVLGIAHIVLVIVASIRANEGRAYRYPLTIRFIK